MDYNPYEIFPDTKGEKLFELSNHLGNVLAGVSDKISAISGSVVSFSAEVVHATDYYPFGMGMPGRQSVGGYRYGFNGKERDEENFAGAYDFGARILDVRLGRWMSIDELAEIYTSFSPYCSMINNPIIFQDPDGRRIYYVNDAGEKIRVTKAQIRLIDNVELRAAAELMIATKSGKTIFNHFSRSRKHDIYLGTSTNDKRDLDEWNCPKGDALGTCVPYRVDFAYSGFPQEPQSSLFNGLVEKGRNFKEGFQDFGIILFNEGLFENSRSNESWDNALTLYHEFLHGNLNGTEDEQHAQMGVRYEDGNEKIIRNGIIHQFMKEMDKELTREISELDKRMRKAEGAEKDRYRKERNSVKESRSKLRDSLKEKHVNK